jgi:putative CRISPR-associated protein (TIGR02619 family)
MKRTILTTVGTSLLTNGDRPWASWTFRQRLPESGSVHRWLQSADPIKASAETHTWYRLGLFEVEDKSQIEVVLIHSHTEDGAFCAERLLTWASGKGLTARCRQVAGLTYSDGPTFNRGLRQLARAVGEEIKRGQATGTAELAATGGFKAEIAVANLVGAVSDTPVHYIYHEFSSLITIDPIPVTLRADWVGSGAGRSLLEAFKSAHDIIPAKAIESLLKQDERLLSLVELHDGDAALNLLGEIALRLIEAPQQTWPPATDDAPASKKRLESAAHHRPRGSEQIVNTIAESRYVTSIRYEGSVAGGCLREAPDNDSDLVHRIEGSPPLTLRISTTARTAEQRRLVQQLLRKELKL